MSSDQASDADEFEPGSAEAEAHLERLVRLGFPHLAQNYAARKNLVEALERLTGTGPAAASAVAEAGRPQYISLVAGLFLVWMGSAMFFRIGGALLLAPSMPFMRLGLMIASVAVLLVATVLLSAMTKHSLRTFRRVLRGGIPVACVAGLVAAFLL